MQYSERATLAPYSQGLVVANAAYDSASQRTAVHDSQTLSNPLYGGAALPDNQGVFAHEIAYMKCSSQRNGGLGAAKMAVRTTLNGEGGEEARNNPNDKEFVRDSVRNKIKLAGVAMLTTAPTTSQTNLGVSLAVSGLTQLRQGKLSGHARVMPGDRLVAEVPLGGGEGLQTRSGSFAP